VVWHDDVAEDEEAVSQAECFECFLEDCACVFVVEVRVLVVAGEGYEVVVAGGLVSFEATGHGEMVIQAMVVRVSGVPHSCAKCAHEWATRRFVVSGPSAERRSTTRQI